MLTQLPNPKNDDSGTIVNNLRALDNIANKAENNQALRNKIESAYNRIIAFKQLRGLIN